MKACSSCSQVTQFSADTETFPPWTVTPENLVLFVRPSLSVAWLLLYSQLSPRLHPKFVHDTSYRLRIEKLILPLSFAHPCLCSSRPASLLSFFSSRSLQQWHFASVCVLLQTLPTHFAQNGESGQKRGEHEDGQRNRGSFPEYDFSDLLVLSAVMCLPRFMFSTRENLHSHRTHSSAITFLIILSVTSRVLFFDDTFSSSCWDRSDVLGLWEWASACFFSAEKKTSN